MSNFEVWNSNPRNKPNKRDCIDIIKYRLDENDKIAVIANKNVVMFMKKSVDKNLLQVIEGTTANDSYRNLVEMAPEKNTTMRKKIVEALEVCSVEMESYVLEHQSTNSLLMKAYSQETTKATTHPAHMSRLLDDLSDYQQTTMSYLMSFWEDRGKASAKNVLKVGFNRNKDLGKTWSVLGTKAVSCRQSKVKSSNDKCLKHSYLHHKWETCDLNLNTTDIAERDKRKTEKVSRQAIAIETGSRSVTKAKII